jgi:hypothetical protein
VSSIVAAPIRRAALGLLAALVALTTLATPDPASADADGSKPSRCPSTCVFVLDRSLHGYLWEGGRYERLDVPGTRATAAADINNRGDVVGEVKDADGRIRGFARLGGRYRFVDGPGEGNTSYPIHVNDQGDILVPAPGTIEGLVDLVE